MGVETAARLDEPKIADRATADGPYIVLLGEDCKRRVLFRRGSGAQSGHGASAPGPSRTARLGRDRPVEASRRRRDALP